MIVLLCSGMSEPSSNSSLGRVCLNHWSSEIPTNLTLKVPSVKNVDLIFQVLVVLGLTIPTLTTTALSHSIWHLLAFYQNYTVKKHSEEILAYLHKVPKELLHISYTYERWEVVTSIKSSLALQELKVVLLWCKHFLWSLNWSAIYTIW